MTLDRFLGIPFPQLKTRKEDGYPACSYCRRRDTCEILARVERLWHMKPQRIDYQTTLCQEENNYPKNIKTFNERKEEWEESIGKAWYEQQSCLNKRSYLFKNKKKYEQLFEKEDD